MSEQSLVIHRPTVDLLAADSQTEIKAMAYKISKFAPGGENLTGDQAVALAVYAWMTDLNPYNNECYHMKGVGPTAGIAGYRRKAKEYNRVIGGDDNWDYKISYRLAQPHEAEFNPDNGDVAWVCELTDTKAEREWQDVYARFFKMAIEAGAPWKDADARAMMIAGERPTWTGTGVVKASEHFSGIEYENWQTKTAKKDKDGNDIYKAEMWDRNERAKKRAEKQALKKRYPDLLIPDFGEVYDQNVDVIVRDVTKVIDAEVIESRAAIEAMTPQERSQAADAIVADLCFSDNGESEQQAEAVQDPLWVDPVGIYYEVTDSKGTPYREKGINELSFSLTALNKKVKAFKEPTNDDELNMQNDLLLKRDAVLFWMNQKKDQDNG